MGIIYQSSPATEDKQDAQLAVLNLLQDSLTALINEENDPGIISQLQAISTALTSQATAANQATGNVTLASILSALTGVSTTALQTAGNASLSALVTRAGLLSTEAKQDLTNSLLAAIDAKIGSTTGALSTVPQTSNASVVLLAANPNRKGFLLYNDSGAKVYISFAATASATAFSIFLGANSGYESAQTVVYKGAVSARWVSGNSGSMQITELS